MHVMHVPGLCTPFDTADAAGALRLYTQTRKQHVAASVGLGFSLQKGCRNADAWALHHQQGLGNAIGN
jgi:hypothetical protein